MSEDLFEQVAYGDHCIHGTAIGTPGGADLMCGLCESGLTQWIEDPRYDLWAVFQLDDGTDTPIKLRASWRLSEDPDEVMARVDSRVRQCQEAFDKSGFEPTFEARRADLGYWDEPDPLQDLGDYYGPDDTDYS